MNIATPEQIETIDKYINEQNFSEKDTGRDAIVVGNALQEIKIDVFVASEMTFKEIVKE